MTKEGLRIYYKCEMVRGNPWDTNITILKKMGTGDIEIKFPGEQLEYDPSEIVPNSKKIPDEAGRKRAAELTQKECELTRTDEQTKNDYIEFFDYKIPKLEDCE